MNVEFFASPAELRKWLEANADQASELWLGFHKRSTGKQTISYSEALDQALCFGWIDGVRKRIDDTSFTQRFSPRRPRSNWSEVNIRRAQELISQGLMTPAGLRAFEARDEAKTKSYSYEARHRPLEPEYEERLRAHLKAWEFFQAQAPSYQKAASWWVMSAKKEDTRQRRLELLIECSEQGERIPPLRR